MYPFDYNLLAKRKIKVVFALEMSGLVAGTLPGSSQLSCPCCSIQAVANRSASATGYACATQSGSMMRQIFRHLRRPAIVHPNACANLSATYPCTHLQECARRHIQMGLSCASPNQQLGRLRKRTAYWHQHCQAAHAGVAQALTGLQCLISSLWCK